MWYVYIVQCSDRSLYIGTTTNISRRIREHNSKKGGSYTCIRLPVKLLYKEYYLTIAKAQKRETQIILRQAQDDPEQVKRVEGTKVGQKRRNWY